MLIPPKKRNRDKFESVYEYKPQTEVAGTKHTIATDTNKIIHRKRISKPLNSKFQNPLITTRGKPEGEKLEICTAGTIRRQ